MGHKIAEAIIENGQIRYVNKKLPRGRLKVHLIYDDMKEVVPETKVTKIVRKTSGIYKDINIETESRKLRASWERNIHI